MIEFAGVRSDEKYIVVEHYPKRYIPKRKLNVQPIPGGDHDYILSEGDDAFSNYEQPYSVFLDSKAPGLPMVSRGLAEWLLGAEGYQRLEDSYDPDFYRMAYYSGGEDFVNFFNEYGRGTLTFTCAPKRYYKSGEVPISITAQDTVLYSPSLFRAWPIVEFDIINSGDCTVRFTEKGTGIPYAFVVNTGGLSSGHVTIDAKRHVAYAVDDGVTYDLNRLVLNEYENLRLFQVTEVSWFQNNVANVVVTPRWWTI